MKAIDQDKLIAGIKEMIENCLTEACAAKLCELLIRVERDDFAWNFLCE